MFILKYALKNIIRNPFISLSSLVVIGLLVFFINILLLVLFSTDKFIESVNDRISITIPYQSGYTDQSLRSQQLFYLLESSFSGIEANYVSRDEAFLIFRARNPDLARLIESTEENPLPSSIQLSGIPLGSYEAVQGTIAQYKDILEYDENAMNRKLIDFQSQYNRIEWLVKILRLLEYGVYALLILFVFTVFVVVYTIISNTIFFLRDEMSIIELVGGKSYFIYGPLVIQGMIYTFSATLLALALFYALPYMIPLSSFPEVVSTILTAFFVQFSEYVVFGVLAAILLGMISAFVASWKYIHKTIG
jgi:cell division transport system permease protein